MELTGSGIIKIFPYIYSVRITCLWNIPYYAYVS